MLTETARSPLLANATTASFMFPKLTAVQIERIAAHGVLRRIRRGEVLIEGGQHDVPFFVVKAGEIEDFRPSALGDLLIAVVRARATKDHPDVTTEQQRGDSEPGCHLTGGPTAPDSAPDLQCSVATARCSVRRLLEMKELHRILHRLPASRACCGLLAVFGWFVGSN